jgi:diguanylate cyclase (GGDEF)-like protein
MHLDMLTMSAVDVTVTVVLGLVLLFTWLKERGVRLVGWWGLILLVQAAGLVVCAGGALADQAILITAGLAIMVSSDALKWTAAREFVDQPTPAWWALGVPLVFVLPAYTGLLGGLRDQFIVFSVLTALVNLGAAFELARAKGERLISHWPAVVLLTVTASACLFVIPLSFVVPFHTSSEAYLSGWFSTITLVMVIVRIALAFVVLNMAKQRQEMEQRVHALTDTLTGLPNRRALYETLDVLERKRRLKAQPISVLIFDLDHFKDINDTFGHEVGDRILRVFAVTAAERLKSGSMLARMGGEEFAAVLTGVEAAGALAFGEDVRKAFAQSAGACEEGPVGATVSVGVACCAAAARHATDIGALFRQADAALYAAKRGGRNRVQLAETEDVIALPAAEVAAPDVTHGETTPDRRPRRRVRATANA